MVHLTRLWPESLALAVGVDPNPKEWTSPNLFVDLSRALERAAFDYVMIEDSSNIPYTYKNSHETYLRYAVDSPKLDPAVLASFLIQATRQLGVVTTLSTTEYHPFQLARLTNTLDHVSHGRAGWNLVTGSNDGGAQNFGLERQYPHDQRYDMADEYVDLVIKLWESWDADAVVLDRENEIFADPAKVRPVHFSGQYYHSRGPLGAPRSPQGAPRHLPSGRFTTRPPIRCTLGRDSHRHAQKRGGDESLSRRYPRQGA